MPIQVSSYRAGAWKVLLGNPIAPGINRDLLVAGVDKPTALTTGVTDASILENVYPVAGQYVLPLAPGTYENKMFWGQVKPPYVTGTNFTFRNCWFAFPDFNWTAYDTNLIGGISNTPNNSVPPFINLIDCTIDPTPWFNGHPGRPAGWTPGPNAEANRAQTAGFHGSNINMQRCEINGAQDGINYVGWGASTGTFEMNWIHNNYFRNNWYGPSDGRCHSDSFQFNTGSNITIRGNILGGHRDMTGYTTWPGGYNSGDDAWNAALMIKQEASNDDNRRIENVLIEGNWIYGGTAGINFAYNPTYPNTFSTTTIRNNRFGTRGTGWRGSATGVGTYDTGNGWYIIRNATLAATITGNINEDTSAAVPITNG